MSTFDDFMIGQAVSKDEQIRKLTADAERYQRIRYCRKFVGMLETATMHCDTDAEYDEAVDGMPRARP